LRLPGGAGLGELSDLRNTSSMGMAWLRVPASYGLKLPKVALCSQMVKLVKHTSKFTICDVRVTYSESHWTVGWKNSRVLANS
jgi:hypothetical protein